MSGVRAWRLDAPTPHPTLRLPVVCTPLVLRVLDGALTHAHIAPPPIHTHTVTCVGLVQAPGPEECLSPLQPLTVGRGDVWGLPRSNANTCIAATTSRWRGAEGARWPVLGLPRRRSPTNPSPSLWVRPWVLSPLPL